MCLLLLRRLSGASFFSFVLISKICNWLFGFVLIWFFRVVDCFLVFLFSCFVHNQRRAWDGNSLFYFYILIGANVGFENNFET